MIKPYLLFIFFPFIILFSEFSCTSNICECCITKAGNIETYTQKLEDFNKIEITDKFDIFIKKGIENRISIEGGKNFLPGIDFIVQNHTLKIKDNNSCRWLKTNNIPIKILISSNNIDSIFLLGPSSLYSTDTLKFDRLYIQLDSELADIDLIVNNKFLKLDVLNTTGSFKFRGYTDYGYVGNWGYGHLFASDCMMKEATIANFSTGHCHVNVINDLHAEIGGKGNIYYKIEPKVISLTRTPNTGQLLKE
jgi:hypothetical protein